MTPRLGAARLIARRRRGARGALDLGETAHRFGAGYLVALAGANASEDVAHGASLRLVMATIPSRARRAAPLSIEPVASSTP